MCEHDDANVSAFGSDQSEPITDLKLNHIIVSF